MPWGLKAQTKLCMAFMINICWYAAIAASGVYDIRRYGEDAVNYAFGLAMGGTPCDKAAVKMLKEVLEKVW